MEYQRETPGSFLVRAGTGILPFHQVSTNEDTKLIIQERSGDSFNLKVHHARTLGKTTTTPVDFSQLDPSLSEVAEHDATLKSAKAESLATHRAKQKQNRREESVELDRVMALSRSDHSANQEDDEFERAVHLALKLSNIETAPMEDPELEKILVLSLEDSSATALKEDPELEKILLLSLEDSGATALPEDPELEKILLLSLEDFNVTALKEDLELEKILLLSLEDSSANRALGNEIDKQKELGEKESLELDCASEWYRWEHAVNQESQELERAMHPALEMPKPIETAPKQYRETENIPSLDKSNAAQALDSEIDKQLPTRKQESLEADCATELTGSEHTAVNQEEYEFERTTDPALELSRAIETDHKECAELEKEFILALGGCNASQALGNVMDKQLEFRQRGSPELDCATKLSDKHIDKQKEFRLKESLELDRAVMLSHSEHEPNQEDQEFEQLHLTLEMSKAIETAPKEDPEPEMILLLSLEDAYAAQALDNEIEFMLRRSEVKFQQEQLAEEFLTKEALAESICFEKESIVAFEEEEKVMICEVLALSLKNF